MRRSSRRRPLAPRRPCRTVSAAATASALCCFPTRHRTKPLTSAGSGQAPPRGQTAVSVVRQPC
jgi:hypothetical protein